MNGKRSFLLATVLSVQHSSFTYPACKNCLSRVVPTPSGCKCLRCGFTGLESNHRYKLCVKVAAGGRLGIVTVFGRCLEPIFGVDADSLQRLLQDSAREPGVPEEADARHLLLQAVESYFIGRSFVFGVKVPAGPHARDDASLPLLIACYISLPNDDPIRYTVVHHYNRLRQSFLRSTGSPDGTFAPSDDSTRSSSILSENTYDFQEDEEQHVLDFWHESFGLTSSSPGGSSSSSSLGPFSKNSPRSLELSSCESGGPLIRSTQASLEEVKPDIVSIYNVGTSKSNATIPPMNISALETNWNPPNPSEPPDSSVKHTSQERTSGLSSKNTAGTHHGEEEEEDDGREDSLFSESLTEFIARIEEAEDAKSLNFKAYKRDSNFVDDSSPARFHKPEDGSHSRCANTAPGRRTEGRGFRKDSDPEPNILICNDLSKVSTTGLRSPAETLSGDVLRTSPHDFREDVLGSLQRGDWDTKKSPTTRLSGFNVNRKDNLFWEIQQSGISTGKPDDLGQTQEHKSSQRDGARGITEFGVSSSADDLLKSAYNTSADLFEISDRVQGKTPWGRGGGDAVGPSGSELRESKRADESRTRAFCPRSQSTPLLEHVLRSERIRINKKLHSDNESVFLGQASDRSLRRVLLKNMALENKSRAPFRALTCNVLHRSPLSESPILGCLTNDSGECEAVMPPHTMVASIRENPGVSGAGMRVRQRYITVPATPNVTFPAEDKENEIEGGLKNDGRGETEMNASLNSSPSLSPVTRLPLTPRDYSGSYDSSCDWSPELFSEKSNTHQQNDRPQKRLFK